MYNELQDNKAIPQWKAGAIPLLQWSYSGFTVHKVIGIWTTNNGSVKPFLTFFPLLRKTVKLMKMKLDQK